MVSRDAWPPAREAVGDRARNRRAGNDCDSHARAPLPPLGENVLIVSGLPRSGTSMLTQMLDAGGMPILTDKLREANETTPRATLSSNP